MQSVLKTSLQLICASVVCALFCLLGEALFAIVVKAYAPSYEVIRGVNLAITAVGCFLGGLICVRKSRALFKGMGGGLLSVLFTMVLFGLIGGFHVTPFLLVELLIGGIFGGIGAIVGVSLRKE